MSSVTFRGTPVSRVDVLCALAEFDAVYEDYTNDHDGWLDKGVYRCALHVGGRLYSPKPILSVVCRTVGTIRMRNDPQTHRTSGAGCRSEDPKLPRRVLC